MELLDFPIQLRKTTEPVFIHVFSDIHRAAAGCDIAQLRSDINRLKHSVEKKGEQHYWLGGGDWINGIGPKDKRLDSAAIAPAFQKFVGDDLFGAEAHSIASEFRKIRDYGIGIGTGNHEDAVARHGEFNPSKRIAAALELPYLGYSAVIRFCIRKGTRSLGSCIAYWHHGKGAAASKGGKVNMLFGMRDVIEADVYIVGHVHEPIDFPESRLSVPHAGKMRLKERDLVFINSGTYLKAYETVGAAQKPFTYDEERQVRSDYAEKKAYRPSVIGHNGWRMTVGRGQGDYKQILNKRLDFRV